MLRLSVNICSKALFNHQPIALKLSSRSLAPKHLEKYACMKFSTKPDEQQIKDVAGNPEHIYHGILSRHIQAVKLFSLTSSVLGLSMQPVLIEKSSEIGGTGMMVAVCGMLGFFTFVTPVLLHFITKKYVIDMEYNHKTKTYIASTISFFMRRKEFEFKPEDVDVPDALGMFTSCYIRGTPLFFDLKHFKDPEHYAKIMGYDKPMDFKMGLDVSPLDEPKK